MLHDQVKDDEPTQEQCKIWNAWVMHIVAQVGTDGSMDAATTTDPAVPLAEHDAMGRPDAGI